MAFSVNFFRLSKRENSTLRPTGDPAASFSCRLKDGCGIVSPVIILTMGNDNPSRYNYCYISEFSRYYYISEYTYERGEWSITLVTDVMATYRSQIGSASLYVLRSSAAQDGRISDGMYPIRAGITVEEGGPSANWWNNYNPGRESLWTPQDGIFVMGVLSYVGSDSVFGGVNYLAFGDTMLRDFLNQIYTTRGNPMSNDFFEKAVDQIGTNFTADEIANLSYVVENPYTDYVKSLMWIPGFPADADLRTSVWFGHKQFQQNCFVFNPGQPIILTADLPFANHPLAASRGVYMNMAPFTDSYLILPRIGVVPIDNSLFVTQSPQRMQVELQLDPISGVGVYILYVYSIDGEGVGRKSEIARWSGKIGVNVSLSETKDIGEQLNAILSAVRPVASLASGDVAGAITGAGAAITNIRRSQETNGGTIGSNDGWLGLANEYRKPRILHIYHDVAPDDNAHNGRPLCQVRQLSTIPGFIKVQDGDVAIPGTAGEAATLRSYLEGGFFYE